MLLVDGRRVHWASLEVRMPQREPARAGGQLWPIGLSLGLHRKIRHCRRQDFNTETGSLVRQTDGVNVALDINARQPIEILPSIRNHLERCPAQEIT